MQIKQLEKEIKWSGDGLGNNPVLLTQIKREGSVAIYERKNLEGVIKGYEVIRIKIRKNNFANGEQYEHYPSAKEFGPLARFCIDFKRALQVYNEFMEKEKALCPQSGHDIH